MHDRTEEWIFILSGRAQVRGGDDRFEVGAEDFLGHPADGPAHRRQAIEPLTYLVGGGIDLDDVVTYADARRRLVRGALEPLP